MGCWNLPSGPNSNHRLETTVYRPLVCLALRKLTRPGFEGPIECRQCDCNIRSYSEGLDKADLFTLAVRGE